MRQWNFVRAFDTGIFQEEISLTPGTQIAAVRLKLLKY